MRSQRNSLLVLHRPPVFLNCMVFRRCILFSSGPCHGSTDTANRSSWRVYISCSYTSACVYTVPGRANAGKSSLFNAVLGRKSLLHTSKQAVSLLSIIMSLSRYWLCNYLGSYTSTKFLSCGRSSWEAHSHRRTWLRCSGKTWMGRDVWWVPTNP